ALGGGLPPARAATRRPRAVPPAARARRGGHRGAAETGRLDVLARRARRVLPRRGTVGGRRDRGARRCAGVAALGLDRRRRRVPSVRARRARLRSVTAIPSGRPPLRSERRHRRRRLLAVTRWALRLLVLGAVFAGGVALGEALHDNPKPGPAQTLVRTLRPLP